MHGDCHLGRLGSLYAIIGFLPHPLDAPPVSVFDEFWLRLNGLWKLGTSVSDTDPLCGLVIWFEATTRKLASSSAYSVGNVPNKMVIS